MSGLLEITYIKIEDEFNYLAVILDLFSRKVVSYSISKRTDSELALSTLKITYEWRDYAQGVIHHSARVATTG